MQHTKFTALTGYGPSLCYSWRVFLQPEEEHCTARSEQGTARNAIEAGDSCFSARSGSRRRFLHRAGVGCLLRSGVIEAGTAGSFDDLAADSNDRHRINLRLSPHRAKTKATSVSHRHPGYSADTLDLRARFRSDFTRCHRRSGPAWATRRVLTRVNSPVDSNRSRFG